ncbi:C-type mannose receptor 2-like, partial [Homarus americanus]|uniref:C-type mannose receptor 2-like n=1 Tax=Homarus americanus TaxID=6706 RepID=UPI001C47B46A
MVVWDDAKSTCEAVGASLVVLDDETEDRFFRNHMPETDTLWIGLFSVPEDQFYWTDNTTMASKNFTHVSDENEDAALHADDNRCVFLQTEAIGHDAPVSSWMPIDCKEPRHYACEIPAGETVHLISPSNERYCPEGWSNEFDHCYMFSEEEKTWTAAQRECQSHQAHLVSVATWAEQDYVFNHQGGGGWLGLNDRALEGSWVWSDGTSVTITNWNEGEPSGGDKNCVEMIDSAGKWNDVRCEQERPFICKRKASDTPIYPVTTTTAKPDYSNCGWDWTENPVSGECYRFELQELTFRDAHLQCRELDHHHDDERPELISFTTAQEQDFIEKLVSEQQLSQSTLWIGMKNDIDGNRWLDGTPVGFFNWNFGEPNGVYVDYCVEMYTYGGKWNDVGCSQRRAFLCEKK